MQTTDLVRTLEQIAIASVGLTTRALASAAPGTDLTFPQWRALLITGESEDGARVGEVAARVGVTVPATSRLLRRLERRGLIVLQQDPEDRRATRARLSEHGLAVRSAIVAYRREALLRVAAEVDGAGAVNFEDGLERIAAALAAYR